MPAVTADTAVASDEEVLRYVTAYIAASNALGDAIVILKRLEADAVEEGEMLSLMIQRRKVEDDYSRNERSFLAFNATTLAMHPPSQEEVNAIVMLAAEVAKLTVDKADAAAVVLLATDIAGRFNDIKD